MKWATSTYWLQGSHSQVGRITWLWNCEACLSSKIIPLSWSSSASNFYSFKFVNFNTAGSGRYCFESANHLLSFSRHELNCLQSFYLALRSCCKTNFNFQGQTSWGKIRLCISCWFPSRRQIRVFGLLSSLLKNKPSSIARDVSFCTKHWYCDLKCEAFHDVNEYFMCWNVLCELLFKVRLLWFASLLSRVYNNLDWSKLTSELTITILY